MTCIVSSCHLLVEVRNLSMCIIWPPYLIPSMTTRKMHVFFTSFHASSWADGHCEDTYRLGCVVVCGGLLEGQWGCTLNSQQWHWHTFIMMLWGEFYYKSNTDLLVWVAELFWSILLHAWCLAVVASDGLVKHLTTYKPFWETDSLCEPVVSTK